MMSFTKINTREQQSLGFYSLVVVLEVLGLQLDSPILKVFSNLNDSPLPIPLTLCFSINLF